MAYREPGEAPNSRAGGRSDDLVRYQAQKQLGGRSTPAPAHDDQLVVAFLGHAQDLVRRIAEARDRLADGASRPRSDAGGFQIARHLFFELAPPWGLLRGHNSACPLDSR